MAALGWLAELAQAGLSVAMAILAVALAMVSIQIAVEVFHHLTARGRVGSTNRRARKE